MKNQARSLIIIGILLTVFSVSLGLPFSAAAQSTTLEQRLEQYKKDRNIDSRRDTQSIKLRCGIAQASMKNLLVRILAAQKSRQTAYKNITDVLTNLQKSLNEQAFETTTLKSVTDTYDAKVALYTTDMDAYRQAVEDAVAVDCVKDPYGFMAALETARLYHDKLTPDISDIRSYATNTIKSTLDQIKQQLASGRTTGGQQ